MAQGLEAAALILASISKLKIISFIKHNHGHDKKHSSLNVVKLDSPDTPTSVPENVGTRLLQYIATKDHDQVMKCISGTNDVSVLNIDFKQSCLDSSTTDENYWIPVKALIALLENDKALICVFKNDESKFYQFMVAHNVLHRHHLWNSAMATH